MTDHVTDAVRDKYGSVAASDLSSAHDGVRAVAEAFGYSLEDLRSIPAEANMGLSCGNPTAFASLREGETVVDLGCGGGLDVFLAAQKVGPAGQAIGIDMTPEMIDRAKRSAEAGHNGQPYTNVAFHLATIDNLPLADASVDCVVSNCVINLAPDKPAVFREIARVLKPGGRLAVSDIALKKPLPEGLARDVAAYVGCIAGAISVDAYREGLKAAGLTQVEVIDSGADLNAYAKVENQSGCCSPVPDQPQHAAGGLNVVGSCCGGSAESSETQSAGQASNDQNAGAEGSLHERMKALLAQYDVNEYAASTRIFAVKPAN